MRTLLLLMAAFWIAGCAGTPKPGDRTLVSVSFVNTGNSSYEHVRLTLDGEEPAAHLEALGPYREEWLEFARVLPRQPRMSLSWVAEGRRVLAPVRFVTPPVRRAADRRYHLRVHLRGEASVAELEPLEQARRRWELRSGAAR